MVIDEELNQAQVGDLDGAGPQSLLVARFVSVNELTAVNGGELDGHDHPGIRKYMNMFLCFLRSKLSQ